MNLFSKLKITGTVALLIAMIGILGVSKGNAQSSQSEVDAIVHGERLSKLNCASCHNIGLNGDSPHEKAPPFRELGERRSMESIFSMLLFSEAPEHSDMPKFTVTPEQADDIVEWISWVQPVAHGKRLVDANCARCHAVSMEDESPFPAAIPFRNISALYPVDALEEAFAERIETGHPAMPVFEVTIPQLRSIIAYIETLQE